jgi:hypothetical protein
LASLRAVWDLFDIYHFPQLEVFRFLIPVQFRLSVVSPHPTLRTFTFSRRSFIFGNICSDTYLQFIALMNWAKIFGDRRFAHDLCVAVDQEANSFPIRASKHTNSVCISPGDDQTHSSLETFSRLMFE